MISFKYSLAAVSRVPSLWLALLDTAAKQTQVKREPVIPLAGILALADFSGRL
jgi:hypothetical protein